MKFLLKYKWHLISVVFVLALVLLFMLKPLFLGEEGAERATKKLTKWVFDRRTEIISDAVKRSSTKTEEQRKKVGEASEKLEEIRQKKSEVKEDVASMELEELERLSKSLGF